MAEPDVRGRIQIEHFVPLEFEQLKHVIANKVVGHELLRFVTVEDEGEHQILLVFEGGVGLLLKNPQRGVPIITQVIEDPSAEPPDDHPRD